MSRLAAVYLAIIIAVTLASVKSIFRYQNKKPLLNSKGYELYY